MCGYATENVQWIVLSEILSTVDLQVTQAYERVIGSSVVLLGNST